MSGNVKVERARLRSRIDGEAQLRYVATILEWLVTGTEPVRTVDGRIEDPKVKAPLDASRVAALSKALDVHLKLLNKVLPDLKAVELTGEDGAPVSVQQADKLVLATKLLAVMREVRPNGHEVEVDALPPWLE